MLTQKVVDNLQDDLQEAIKKVGEKYKLNIYMNGGNFNSTGADLKIKVTETGKALETSRQERFNRICRCYGLKESDYGKEAEYQGKVLVLAGINDGARKFCILCRDITNGTEVGITPELAVELFSDNNI